MRVTRRRVLKKLLSFRKISMCFSFERLLVHILSVVKLQEVFKMKIVTLHDVMVAPEHQNEGEIYSRRMIQKNETLRAVSAATHH